MSFILTILSFIAHSMTFMTRTEIDYYKVAVCELMLPQHHKLQKGT